MKSDRQVSRVVGVLVALLVMQLFMGCESMVETDPPSNRITSLNVFSTDNTAIAAVTDVYAGMVVYYSGPGSFSMTCGLSADELTLFSEVPDMIYQALYRNELRSNASASFGGEYWGGFYLHLLAVNSALEGITESSTLSSSVRTQLLGEAYFLRAYLFFYLTNLYGDVPLVLTSDPNINNRLARSPQADVYTRIIDDLTKARGLLNPDYAKKDMLPYASNAERIRPNRAAATALLARVQLYRGNPAEAEAAATEVINQSTLYGLLPLNEVFLKNSRESIWQLQPIRANRNTDDAWMFVLPATGPSGVTYMWPVMGNPVYLSQSLLDGFEAGDARAMLGNWINRVVTSGGETYYYPFKYKSLETNVTEYHTVMRLGEQFLIRAEARAQQGNTAGAIADLNVIRERAGLPVTTETSEQGLLDAILSERRSELFTEWGHRWLDLKRVGKVNEVMSVETPKKGGVWENHQQWYPVPYNDVLRGPNLVQTAGY